MNNAGITYKYTTTVGDNYGIISSYLCDYSNVEDSLQIHPKTTLFQYTISTEEENRGKRKRNKTEKED